MIVSVRAVKRNKAYRDGGQVGYAVCTTTLWDYLPGDPNPLSTVTCWSSTWTLPI